MKKVIEYGIIIVLGGVLYMIIELLWIASTHWTMGIAGGLSFVIMYVIHNKMKNVHIITRAMLCAIAGTLIEFMCGCIVNIGLGWDVWDYSKRSFNLMGQICPLYSLFWFFLSIPASEISKILNCIIDRHLEATGDYKIKTEREVS